MKKNIEQRYMNLVNGEYRVHSSLHEAREYELKNLGFTSWSADRRRFKISLPAPLFKGLVSAIIIQTVLFTLIFATMVIVMASCAPAKKFNDPAAMRQVKREMKNVGRI